MGKVAGLAAAVPNPNELLAAPKVGAGSGAAACAVGGGTAATAAAGGANDGVVVVVGAPNAKDDGVVLAAPANIAIK